MVISCLYSMHKGFQFCELIWLTHCHFNLVILLQLLDKHSLKVVLRDVDNGHDVVELQAADQVRWSEQRGAQLKHGTWE